MRNTTIGTTSPQIAGYGQVMNQELLCHFEMFIRSSYVIRRLCTIGIAETIEI